MSVLKLLTGEQLLERGACKQQNTLPVKGAKNVLPTGSWLEQKQVQAALEARKHLLEDERVEKWGVLSHAEWDENLQLARVIEYKGCHWNYLGHNVGKQRFLYPEEALFLMEVNCLQLKFGDVQVSLQQAYTLLLSGTITILEYKVYSELSRVGYRVLRTNPEPVYVFENLTEYEKQINLGQYYNRRCKENTGRITDLPTNESKISEKDNESQISVKENEILTQEIDNSNEICREINANLEGSDNISENKITGEVSENVASDKARIDENDTANSEDCNRIEVSPVATTAPIDWRAYPLILVLEPKCWAFCNLTNEKVEQKCIQSKETIPQKAICSNPDTLENTFIPIKTKKTSPKLYKEYKRNTTKVLSTLNLPDFFQSVSNIQGKETITINAPDETHLPRNVFLNQNTYTLKITKITCNERPTRSNHTSDGHNNTNMDNIRCLQSAPRSHTLRSPFHTNFRTPQTFYQLHQYLQPLMPFYQVPSQFRYFPNLFQRVNSMPPVMTQEDETNSRKRSLDISRKQEHLQAIRKVAYRLKQFMKSGNRNDQNFSSLNRLIQCFNSRYNEHIQLTESCTLANDCNENDTIDLEKDERDRKRRRCNNSEQDSQRNKFLENLKSLAFRLQQIKASGESHFRARRHLLKAIKIFNKKFKSNVHLTANFGIKDNQQVVLDSSSDSDCIITGNVEICSKKVKDPLNAAKRNKSSKQINNSNEPIASTSKHTVKDEPSSAISPVEEFYNKFASIFKGWLPSIDDWGRAEVVPAWFCQDRLLNSHQNHYLFENYKGFLDQFKCWTDLKTQYWESLEDSTMDVDEPEEISNEASSDLQPLLRPEDCDNVPSILKRLSIIKTHKVLDTETKLKVHFDVHEKDVKNFRKTDLPTPAFRLICLGEHSPMPAVSEVISLQKQYEDGAPLVVAVVGVGSVSYMQMTASDLPVYVKQSLI